MTVLPISALFFLIVAVGGANRKERVAAGTPVSSVYKYPWIVYIKSEYAYMTDWGEIKTTCFVTCTGSFIDIYGTVITAARCVAHKKLCKDTDNVTRSCQLYFVRVTYGVLSPNQLNAHMVTEGVDPVRDIVRFNLSANSQQDNLDIAMIYVEEFRRTLEMTCRRNSRPRPIKITWRKTIPKKGVFAGFGLQPATRTSKCEYCYAGGGKLSAIIIRTDDQVPRMESCPPPFCYGGYAQIYERPRDSKMRHPQVGGTCLGDTGGPFMIKGTSTSRGFKGMVLQGILTERVQYSYEHPCSGFFDPNYFVDISSNIARRWILSALRRRYIQY